MADIRNYSGSVPWAEEQKPSIADSFMNNFFSPMNQYGYAMMTGRDPMAGMQIGQQFQQQQRMQRFLQTVPEEYRMVAEADPAAYMKAMMPEQGKPVTVGKGGAVYVPGRGFVYPEGQDNSQYGGFDDYSGMKGYETTLRNEFEDRTKVFGEQASAFGRIKASAEDPTAAGDVALLYGYMRLLDPGSTVRESEFGTAEGAASIPERFKGFYNKLVSGERLTEAQRADFTNRAERLYNEARVPYLKAKDKYTNLATRNNIDPENVIVDMDPYGEQQLTNVPNQRIEGLPDPEDLFNLQDSNVQNLMGGKMRQEGEEWTNADGKKYLYKDGQIFEVRIK